MVNRGIGSELYHGSSDSTTFQISSMIMISTAKHEVVDERSRLYTLTLYSVCILYTGRLQNSMCISQNSDGCKRLDVQNPSPSILTIKLLFILCMHLKLLFPQKYPR